MTQMRDEVKKFWDERAREFGKAGEATLREIHLRSLEIRTMTKLIHRYQPTTVLDVGCGNGYSTKLYAQRFPNIQFTGIDYSEQMILHANKDPLPNCRFLVADIMEKGSLPDGQFDLLMTQRCIQNLVDYESQQIAIRNLISKKSSRGIVLLMECSKDGVRQLNDFRVRIGKQPIEDIEPWHNTFLFDQKIVDDFGAHIIHFSSTYMFLRKVLDERLAGLGYLLPAIGKFGYDKIYVIK